MNLQRTASMLCLAGVLAACGDDLDVSHSQSATLTRVQRQLQTTLDDADATLSAAADLLAVTGIDTPAARVLVGGTCLGRPYAIDCATIDPSGVLRVVEPLAYRQYEGTDVSGRPGVETLLAADQPVFSDCYPGYGGVLSTLIGVPVLRPDAALTAAMTMELSPVALCGGIIAPDVAGTPLDAWVMQLDGLIVYETDPTQIGLNLFTDPLYQPYPELVALGERIAAESSGAGDYSFVVHGTDTVVRKHAVWDTVSLDGTDWRVVIYQVVP